MSNNINPIKLGVTGNQYFKQESKEDLTQQAANENKTAEKKENQLASSEILGFMAAQNTDLIPVKTKKTLDVSKYVTPEQEARIANFMKGFEEDYEEAYEIAANEFPEISGKAVSEIALAYINALY